MDLVTQILFLYEVLSATGLHLMEKDWSQFKDLSQRVPLDGLALSVF
jgi:hypothetical protein